jgi:ankyrin repeat protein
MANNITEAFLSACERGDLQVFKQLVSKIDINEKNENGYTGLALAVRNGHTEIVYELIRADADINAVNEVI